MAAPDEHIGKTIANKYRVEQMIGEGGMGKVYKATQLALDKPVVLKVLRQALLSDERTVARFQREAKAASRLNHPNSISVLDFGQADDGAMYIAMEYVQGKDLHHILSREWPLAESRVIRIMSQVLSALADAHSAGVIHRDLKPENIMVEQRRGEADFVKVLDFGIAKIVDGSGDDGPALTRAGFVCGTPEYMSPEQARGAQLDHRSDLYAVGVMIYQLTTGLLPFDSDSAVGFATKHLTEVPLPPSRRRPEAKVSLNMERLIMKALAKNPDDRPQTAEQFRAELLALEKERRQSAGVAPRKPGLSSNDLNRVSRRVTPIDQQETKVNPPGPPPGSSQRSPWASNEQTVRAAPGQGPEITSTNSIPDHVLQREGASREGASSQARSNQSGGALGRSVSEASEVVALRKRSSSALMFRAATVVLVLLAVALGGLFVVGRMRQGAEVLVPAKPDGVVAGSGVPGYMPRQDYDPPKSARRPADAMRLMNQCDEAWSRLAATGATVDCYLGAWQADPHPSIALRLGELNLRLGKTEEAKAWWARFKKDAPDAKAAAYVDGVLKNL